MCVRTQVFADVARGEYPFAGSTILWWLHCPSIIPGICTVLRCMRCHKRAEWIFALLGGPVGTYIVWWRERLGIGFYERLCGIWNLRLGFK